MKKKDISAVIAQEYNYTQSKALSLVTRIFDLIGEALQNDQEVSITKFGKFSPIISKPKMYYNIQTKTQLLHQGKRKKIKFVSWKIFDGETKND